MHRYKNVPSEPHFEVIISSSKKQKKNPTDSTDDKPHILNNEILSFVILGQK